MSTAAVSTPAVSAARVLTVTVSDTRTAANDASGRALAEELGAFVLVRHAIIPDEPDRVLEAITTMMAHDEADAIVFTGGTGLAPRDRTVEALESRFDKRLDGFGEAFRRLSWEQIGPRAVLSRATAGSVGVHLVFALPGSENAVRLGARELLAPILGHAVDLVRGRTAH